MRITKLYGVLVLGGVSLFGAGCGSVSTPVTTDAAGAPDTGSAGDTGPAGDTGRVAQSDASRVVQDAGAADTEDPTETGVCAWPCGC